MLGALRLPRAAARTAPGAGPAAAAAACVGRPRHVRGGAACWAFVPPPSPLPAAVCVWRSSEHGAWTPLQLPFARASTLSSVSASASSGSGGGASALNQQQRPQAFRLHRISGDGACMFRALAQGAQAASTGKAMPLESEGTAAHNLRLAVVAELRKRREEIEPFLPGIAPDFDAYCATMSHPMAWGGEPEMLMASHVLQRPITVYHVPDGALTPIVTYGEHMLGAGVAPVHLLWSGAHYDLLVPQQA